MERHRRGLLRVNLTRTTTQQEQLPSLVFGGIGHFAGVQSHSARLRTQTLMVRTANPDGPLAIQGFASSDQAKPAISRWIHGVSSANSFKNIAAVIAPPQRLPPVFMMSAMLDLMNSLYSSSTGRRQKRSPEICSASLKCR